MGPTREVNLLIARLLLRDLIRDHVTIRGNDRLVIGCDVLTIDRNLFATWHRYR